MKSPSPQDLNALDPSAREVLTPMDPELRARVFAGALNAGSAAHTAARDGMFDVEPTGFLNDLEALGDAFG